MDGERPTAVGWNRGVGERWETRLRREERLQTRVGRERERERKGRRGKGERDEVEQTQCQTQLPSHVAMEGEEAPLEVPSLPPPAGGVTDDGSGPPYTP